MASLKIHSPIGHASDNVLSLAALPEDFARCRLAILDNGKPNALELMRDAAGQLAAQAGVEFVGEFQKGSAATPCEPELLAELQARADLVLTGTAD